VQELKDSNEVCVIDNFITGKRSNLFDDVQLIEGSINDDEMLDKALDGVEIVYHQAALPSVSRSIEDPLSSHANNATGTLRLLKACSDHKITKLVLASSSSVYGDSLELPKRESMVTKPKSPYAVSKLAAECYCMVFNDVFGLRTTALRYFNVFGPRQDPTSDYAAVIPKFIYRMSKGDPLMVYGDGEQTRDFTYVKDVVHANILAASKTSADGKIINIAGGKRISIIDLIHVLENLFGCKNEVVYSNPRVFDIRDSLSDISQAEKLLGYKPEYSLEEGLKETISAFKELNV
jgi:UDP-glucose 4-epimerase